MRKDKYDYYGEEVSPGEFKRPRRAPPSWQQHDQGAHYQYGGLDPEVTHVSDTGFGPQSSSADPSAEDQGDSGTSPQLSPEQVPKQCFDAELAARICQLSVCCREAVLLHSTFCTAKL